MTTMTDTPQDPEARVSPTLDRLLTAELEFEPDAHRGFTSHLAMGLVAAARLGADDATLQTWFQQEVNDGYLRRRAQPPEWLGKGIARIERHGIEAEVRAVAPEVVDRIGGFFHWMIRLELALDSDHSGQVANALGDWHRRPRPDDPIVTPDGSMSVTAVLERVQSTAAEGPDTSWSESDRWREGVAEAADHPDLLAEIAASVAAVHWAEDTFGTLHMVTGTRAARALEPFLGHDDRRRLAPAHLNAVADATTHLTNPAQAPMPIPNRDALPDWDEIGPAAITTGDDHVVKLVYASQLEEAATDHPIYRAIATRAAGLL